MGEERLPKNLQGLLRFAMEHTRAEDAPSASKFEEMDEEKKQFLENVLKSMTVDVIEEFEKALQILENPESSSTEKVAALTSLGDFAGNIDNANNFVKIGGTRVMIPGLNSKDAEIRQATAKLISEMAQNNPYSQQHFLEMNILPKLVVLLNDEEKVVCSAMYAISSLVRGFEPGLTAFRDIGGLECILTCVQSPIEKVAIKAIFLVSSLSSKFTFIRDEFVKLGAIECLTKTLEESKDYDVKQELILSSLCTLTDTSDGLKRCQATDARSKIKKTIENISSDSACEEMVEYGKNLLRHLGNKEDESAER